MYVVILLVWLALLFFKSHMSSLQTKLAPRRERIITTLDIATNHNFKNQPSAEKDLISSATGYGVLAEILKDTLKAVSTSEEAKELDRQARCIEEAQKHLDSISDGKASQLCVDRKIYLLPGSEQAHVIHDIIYQISPE